MKLSFIVCTYNRDKYLYTCLSHLAQNEHYESWELLVINNRSTDNTETECERFQTDFPQVHYHYYWEDKQGLSYARNKGIEQATGDWLIFLDDDALVEPHYVASLLQVLPLYPEAGAFGGPIIPFFEDGKTPDWFSRFTWGFVGKQDLGASVTTFQSPQFPFGANLGIKRTTLDKVGIFNTALGRNAKQLLAGEEKDLGLRIHQAGISVYYFPTLPVQHCIPPHRTTPEFIAKLGRGVGQSERLRTLPEGKRCSWGFVKRCLSEGVKWAGTLLFWLYFGLLGQRQKGDILILFRQEVSKGLLKDAL